MANSASILLKKMKNLEKELLNLKIETFLKLKKMANKTSIVKRTSGILGKKFPSGIKFENSIREKWRKEFKRLNL
jgi:cobalamin biosynthesis Co2+ chelatase CbiK